MNKTRAYLAHLTRETADTITGKILERMPDGTYKYEDIATGAVRFATANLRDEFAIDSRVRIDRVSASRGTIGSQDTITNRAPREQRGLSETTPAEDRVAVDRIVIMTVDPDPLEIREGGDPRAQTFTGTGFDSQLVTYVTSYEGGPDPDITDASAQVLSDTSAAVNISADTGSARGDFDAIINGARAKKALRILRPLPRPALIAIAGNKRSFVAPSTFLRTPTLWLVNAETLELYTESEATAASNSAYFVGGLATLGAEIVIAYQLSGFPFAGPANLMHGATHSGALTPDTYRDAKMAGVTVAGVPSLLIASWTAGATDKGLWLSDLDGGGIARFYDHPAASVLTALTATDTTYIAIGDEITYEVWRDGSGLRASVNLGTANGAVRSVVAPRLFSGGVYGDHAGYYVAVAGNALFKVVFGASAVAASITIPTAGTSAPRPYHAVQVGNRLYFILETTRAIYSIDLPTFSDMQLLATLPADVDEYGNTVTFRYIATDGVSLFVTGSDRKLRRVDVSTAAVTVGSSFWVSPDGVNFWVLEPYQLAFIPGA